MKQLPEQPDDLSLWRFSIISPLLHRHDDSPPLYKEIEGLVQKPYFRPDGKEKYVSTDTVRYWLERYKTLGLDGLRNKVRKDRGSTSVTDSLQKALRDLRKNHPLITFKRILQRLQKDGLWNGRKPSRSALYRFGSRVESLCNIPSGFTLNQFPDFSLCISIGVYRKCIPHFPSPNRKSGFPRYGLPTTFPVCLSIPVVDEI